MFVKGFFVLRIINGFIIGFSLLFISFSPAKSQVLPYLDKQFTCISAAEAQKYKQDFNVDDRAFGGQELCNVTIDFKKLTNDLSLIEFGQFNPFNVME